MTTTPNDEREALASKIVAEFERAARIGGIWTIASVVRETLKMAEAAGFTRQRDADHVLVPRALLREAAEWAVGYSEKHPGCPDLVDFAARMVEAAGEGEG